MSRELLPLEPLWCLTTAPPRTPRCDGIFVVGVMVGVVIVIWGDVEVVKAPPSSTPQSGIWGVEEWVKTCPSLPAPLPAPLPAASRG